MIRTRGGYAPSISGHFTVHTQEKDLSQKKTKEKEDRVRKLRSLFNKPISLRSVSLLGLEFSRVSEFRKPYNYLPRLDSRDIS